MPSLAELAASYLPSRESLGGLANNYSAAPPPTLEALRAALNQTSMRYPGDDPVAELSQGRGGIDAMGVIMGLAGGPRGAVVRPSQGIRAYHGSPYDFERFDASKIGTGEGAQAYGHGLYFAENEKVARQYRDLLGTRHAAVDDPIARAQFWTSDLGSPEAAIKHLEGVLREAQRSPRNFDAGDLAKTSQAIDYLKTGGDLMPKSGHMYEVNIGAKPEQFLDWDKKVRDMPSEVQANLSRLGFNISGPDQGLLGSQMVNRGIDSGGGAGASRAFNEAGIPGIRYLDQGSRSAGQGSSNYVVFDPGIVDILRKYALPGAVALGGAANEMRQ